MHGRGVQRRRRRWIRPPKTIHLYMPPGMRVLPGPLSPGLQAWHGRCQRTGVTRRLGLPDPGLRLLCPVRGGQTPGQSGRLVRLWAQKERRQACNTTIVIVVVPGAKAATRGRAAPVRMDVGLVLAAKAVFVQFIVLIAVTKTALVGKEGRQEIIHARRAVRIPTQRAGRLLCRLRHAKATHGPLGVPQPKIAARHHGPQVNGSRRVVRRVFLPGRGREERRRHGINCPRTRHGFLSREARRLCAGGIRIAAALPVRR
jgi:hypothetical protein